MNKVADKIMPKELAKVMPYIAMAAPFLGPVGMLATLPAQALADAKNYGKLNYKKLALQAAMTGMAKGAQAGKGTAAEKAFMSDSVANAANPNLLPGAGGTAGNAMQFAADNPDAFKTFAEGFKYEPGIAGIGQRFSDAITSTGRSMYNPIDFSEDIAPQLLNKGRFSQAMKLSAPMGIMAGMNAMDDFEQQRAAGGAGTDGALSQDALAQKNYDLMNLYGQNAGYTQDEINTIYGPYGARYGGNYNETVNPMQFTKRQFAGTNYPIFTTFADGGRTGYKDGETVMPMKRSEGKKRQRELEEQAEIIKEALFGATTPGMNEDSIANQMYNIQMQKMMNPRAPRAGGGIMQAPGVPGGMELDYRNSGGFIPMGGPERADDVPAMLSKNEFVMTADAVRGMGGGDVNVGAQKMYDLMNNMEAKV